MMSSSPLSIPLKKKQPQSATKSSLIAHLLKPEEATTAHGLSSGTRLFPLKPAAAPWVPPKGARCPTDGDFSLLVESFSLNGRSNNNNTLVLKATVPSNAKRFSFNLVAPGHDNYDNVLFHFNPRQRQKGGLLVLNDKKEGTWGKAVNIPLSQVPVLFGQSVSVAVQITEAGFDVFVNNTHCARLERPAVAAALQKATSLLLQCPSTDDYGNREDWALEQVWWGRRQVESLNSRDDVVVRANDFDREHPTKLFIRGLPKLQTDAQAELRRSQLERAFWRYGGNLGVRVICPRKKGYAFVEVKNKEMADSALKEMGRHFTICRAQRSRQEAAR